MISQATNVSTIFNIQNCYSSIAIQLKNSMLKMQTFILFKKFETVIITVRQEDH